MESYTDTIYPDECVCVSTHSSTLYSGAVVGYYNPATVTFVGANSLKH